MGCCGNKESWSSTGVNRLIIPSFIHFCFLFFLNQPPFGYLFQRFEWMPTLAGITAHRCPGTELFYSGSQLLGVYLSFVITIQ